MAHLPIVQPNDAPKEVQAVYEEFHRRMSFPSPPNFIMTQGHSPTVARGTWELVRNVLVTGEIPRWTKEMMFVAISKDRQCRYCTAAHIACCRMLGADQETLNQLVRDVHSITNLKLRDMILFAIKCSRDPRSLEETDFDKPPAAWPQAIRDRRDHRDVGLAVYANIMADATAMDEDEMFNKISPLSASLTSHL